MSNWNKWTELTINDVCTITDCLHKTAPSVEYETPYKMLRTVNIRGGRIIRENIKYVTKDTYEKWSVRGFLQKDDIILTREAPMGEVAIIKTDEKFFLGQRTLQLKANFPIVYPDFLYYSLLAPNLQSQIKMHEGTGSVVSNIRIPELKKMRILVPEKVEQQRITSILRVIDDKIELNIQMNQTLEEMAMTLYKHWFVDFGPFQDREFVESELGMIPKGWEVRDFGDIFNLVKDSWKPDTNKENLLYIGLEHIPKGSITLSNWGDSSTVTSNKYQFKKGDILFGKLRPYFKKVGIAPDNGICSTDIMVLRPKHDCYYGILLGCVVQQKFIDYCTSSSSGTRMPRANWTEIKKYKIAVPNDQTILNKFSKKIKTMGEVVIENISENTDLTNIRDYLLPKLLSGKIDLSNVETTLKI